LAKPQAIVGVQFLDPYLKEVRGDCSRCGPDVVAGEGWWNCWDYWSGLDEVYEQMLSDPQGAGSE